MEIFNFETQLNLSVHQEQEKANILSASQSYTGTRWEVY